MQNKGIVMQIANGHAIVMTKNCEFRKIPLLDEMAIGQEVEFELPTELPQMDRKRSFTWLNTRWKKVGVLAASLLLAVGVWSSQSLMHPPAATAATYAYVTVDINPSVELSIDANQKVVNATGLNADGQQVLSGLKLTGLPIQDAVRTLTAFVKSKGYLQNNTEVLITASPAVDSSQLAADHMDLNSIEGELVNQVKTLVAAQNSNAVDVEGVTVSSEVRSAAEQAGVSPGKYALYLALQAKGINVPLTEIKDNSITKVVGDQGNTAVAVLHNLQGGDQLDQLLKQFQNASKSAQNPENVVIPGSSGGQAQSEDQKGKVPPGQAKKDGKQTVNGNTGDNKPTKPIEQPAVREPATPKGNDNLQNQKSNDNGDKGGKSDKGNKNNKGDQNNNQGDHNFKIDLNGFGLHWGSDFWGHGQGQNESDKGHQDHNQNDKGDNH